MRIAYFDCSSGVSGDMILGALLDAGLSLKSLSKALARLKLPRYKLSSSRVMRHGISGKTFTAAVGKHEPHRKLAQIASIVTRSRLGDEVKEKSIEIFTNLARAEARVHGTTLKNIELHEAGATDAIVDIVGAVAGMAEMGIERIYCSPITVARGFIKYHKGFLPLPAPAALELLRGIPLRSADFQGELVTPTGAAIMKTLAANFGAMPPMRVERIGYGAGSSEFPIPNLLRVLIGEMEENWLRDTVTVIEANIDDLKPNVWGYLLERLLREGALDAYLTPVQAKKNRPAIKLSVLSQAEKVDRLSQIIFEETTTLGLRSYVAERRKLERRIVKFRSSLGTVRLKIGTFRGKDITASPEYDDCEKIARRERIPLRDVIERVKEEFTRLRPLSRG